MSINVFPALKGEEDVKGPLGWTFAKCLAYAWNKAKRRALQEGDV